MLPTHKFINRCPQPVLGHHPILVIIVINLKQLRFTMTLKHLINWQSDKDLNNIQTICLLTLSSFTLGWFSWNLMFVVLRCSMSSKSAILPRHTDSVPIYWGRHLKIPQIPPSHKGPKMRVTEVKAAPCFTFQHPLPEPRAPAGLSRLSPVRVSPRHLADTERVSRSAASPESRDGNINRGTEEFCVSGIRMIVSKIFMVLTFFVASGLTNTCWLSRAY